MSNKRCLLCNRPGNKLCEYHANLYMWDYELNGFRLKKKNTGSRYTQNKFHAHEIELTKSIEDYFGKDDVFTSFHPIWAISNKNVLFEYDIVIKSYKILVEYNGIQHYEVGHFNMSAIDLKKQKERDRYKEKMANLFGYKLIIFKYDEPVFEDYVIAKILGEMNG